MAACDLGRRYHADHGTPAALRASHILRNTVSRSGFAALRAVAVNGDMISLHSHTWLHAWATLGIIILSVEFLFFQSVSRAFTGELHRSMVNVINSMWICRNIPRSAHCFLILCSINPYEQNLTLVSGFNTCLLVLPLV
jgi:hypothetical protein